MFQVYGTTKYLDMVDAGYVETPEMKEIERRNQQALKIQSKERREREREIVRRLEGQYFNHLREGLLEHSTGKFVVVREIGDHMIFEEQPKSPLNNPHELFWVTQIGLEDEYTEKNRYCHFIMLSDKAVLWDPVFFE